MTPLVLLFKSLTGPVTSDCLEQILNQLSKAVLSIVNGNRAQHEFVSHALCDLAKLESRPPRLTEIAYEWCSAIHANRDKFEDWENLLLDCLELGFRHLDPLERDFPIKLTHDEHHRGLVDMVFKSRKSEAIADLLCALTANHSLRGQTGEIVGVCTGHLFDLHKQVPFSPRLRQLVIRFVEIAGYKGFESAGVEKLIEYLNHLHVTVKEMGSKYSWLSLLRDVIRSSKEPQRLSDRYWEFLVAFGASEQLPVFENTDALKITKSLIDAEEWGKLECWIGILWMRCGIRVVFFPGEDPELEHPTLLLLRQRPGAAKKLKQWMKRWSRRPGVNIPESFQRILTRAHELAQQQVLP